jgi:hypothetical protein
MRDGWRGPLKDGVPSAVGRQGTVESETLRRVRVTA